MHKCTFTCLKVNACSTKSYENYSITIKSTGLNLKIGFFHERHPKMRKSKTNLFLNQTKSELLHLSFDLYIIYGTYEKIRVKRKGLYF